MVWLFGNQAWKIWVQISAQPESFLGGLGGNPARPVLDSGLGWHPESIHLTDKEMALSRPGGQSPPPPSPRKDSPGLHHRPCAHQPSPGHWTPSSRPARPAGWTSRWRGGGTRPAPQPGGGGREGERRGGSAASARPERKLGEGGSGTHLPPQGVQPHHRPIVGAEGADGVGQDLLQGQQDLVIEAAHQVAVGPAERGASASAGLRHWPALLGSSPFLRATAVLSPSLPQT